MHQNLYLLPTTCLEATDIVRVTHTAGREMSILLEVFRKSACLMGAISRIMRLIMIFLSEQGALAPQLW
jgi:hypothetical protein